MIRPALDQRDQEIPLKRTFQGSSGLAKDVVRQDGEYGDRGMPCVLRQVLQNITLDLFQ